MNFQNILRILLMDLIFKILNIKSMHVLNRISIYDDIDESIIRKNCTDFNVPID
jgi:hypothetical protein